MFMTKIIFILLALLSLTSLAENDCTATDKSNHMHHGNARFVEIWKKCGLDNWGNDPGTTQCLVQSYGNTLSTKCASCFGEHAQCTRSNCWLSCAFSQGESCQNCATKYCEAALTQCTGVAAKDLPSK